MVQGIVLFVALSALLATAVAYPSELLFFVFFPATFISMS